MTINISGILSVNNNQIIRGKAGFK